MTLGSVLFGVVIGYGVHKVAGNYLDKGIDPALAAAKEQIMAQVNKARAKAQVTSVEEKIAAAESVEAHVIEMS